MVSPELEVGGGHGDDGVRWGKSLHGHKLAVPGGGELLDAVASLRVPQLLRKERAESVIGS